MGTIRGRYSVAGWLGSRRRVACGRLGGYGAAAFALEVFALRGVRPVAGRPAVAKWQAGGGKCCGRGRGGAVRGLRGACELGWLVGPKGTISADRRISFRLGNLGNFMAPGGRSEIFGNRSARSEVRPIILGKNGSGLVGRLKTRPPSVTMGLEPISQPPVKMERQPGA